MSEGAAPVYSGIHSAIKENGLLPVAIRQTHLEAGAPNEIHQTENDKFV